MYDQNMIDLEFNTQTYIDKAPFEQVWMGKTHRQNFYRLLCKVLTEDVEGDIVELGCAYGGISALIMHVLRDTGSCKCFHVYDSFQGMPEPCTVDEPQDNILQRGDFRVSPMVFGANIRKFAPGCSLPIVHEGWFENILSNELPNRIAFAFLDSDFYESIRISLEHVYPKLTKGGVMLIDDYCHPRLPGVAKAVDRFFEDKNESPMLIPPDPGYVLDPGKPQCFILKGGRTQ